MENPDFLLGFSIFGCYNKFMAIFPDGFLWGAATSAHQVEGDNLLNDWWDYEYSGKLKYRSEHP